MPSVCFVSNYSLHLRTLTLNHIAYENTKVFTRHHAPSSVCSLTYSQKLSLGIFPEPQEVTISSQTYAPPHGYALRGINDPDADAVRLLKEALPFAKSGKSLPLEIKKLKDKAPEMQRSGAYTLAITKKGITIGS